LHHLYKVDEINGKTLASIHNERFVVRICQKMRQAILDDTFEEYMQSFLSTYYA
jgi:queuine tRNA-ribosyltransferase